MIVDAIRVILFVVFINWAFTMHSMSQSATNTKNRKIIIAISILASAIAAILVL
jgi:hypothetical protein